MEIEVNFYAQLRRIAGAKSRLFSLPAGGSVRQLLAEIVRQAPDLRRELLDEQEELFGHVRLLVNGHDVQHAPDLADTPLQPGDKVSLFPAIGGGWRQPDSHPGIISSAGL